MTRSVGLAIVRAIAAFGRGRWDETISLLLPVRYRANTFGGSHAQRDIVHRTLLEAALRQGDRPLATALAAERTALKPHRPFAWRSAGGPRACRRRRDGQVRRQWAIGSRLPAGGGNGRRVWQACARFRRHG